MSIEFMFLLKKETSFYQRDNYRTNFRLNKKSIPHKKRLITILNKTKA